MPPPEISESESDEESGEDVPVTDSEEENAEAEKNMPSVPGLAKRFRSDFQPILISRKDSDLIREKFIQDQKKAKNQPKYCFKSPKIAKNPPQNCQKIFKSPKQKSSLPKAEKSSDKKWVCQFCNKKFIKRWDVERHIRYKHTKTKPFSCNICGKSFAETGTLVRHQRTHFRQCKCKVANRNLILDPKIKKLESENVGEQPEIKTFCLTCKSYVSNTTAAWVAKMEAKSKDSLKNETEIEPDTASRSKIEAGD